jgi:hypothetical protein
MGDSSAAEIHLLGMALKIGITVIWSDGWRQSAPAQHKCVASQVPSEQAAMNSYTS